MGKRFSQILCLCEPADPSLQTNDQGEYIHGVVDVPSDKVEEAVHWLHKILHLERICRDGS